MNNNQITQHETTTELMHKIPMINKLDNFYGLDSKIHQNDFMASAYYDNTGENVSVPQNNGEITGGNNYDNYNLANGLLDVYADDPTLKMICSTESKDIKNNYLTHTLGGKTFLNSIPNTQNYLKKQNYIQNEYHKDQYD